MTLIEELKKQLCAMSITHPHLVKSEWVTAISTLERELELEVRRGAEYERLAEETITNLRRELSDLNTRYIKFLHEGA